MSRDRRHSLRFETFCIVKIQSPEHGVSHCVARNVSAGGIFLETKEPLPLGTPVRVWFHAPGTSTRLAALGEVKNHYFLHYGSEECPQSLTGMGVRFVTFEGQQEPDAASQASRPGASVH